MGTIFIIFVCVVLPILVLCILQHKHHIMKPFFLGMLVFFLSQIVIRIPMLQLLQQSVQMQIFMIQGIPYYCFLAITAGLFEEVGRYLGYHFLKDHITLRDAVAFGLGHGMIEAILLTALPICSLGYLGIDMVWIAGWERIIAIFAHIGFTIIVWQGIVHKQFRYLIIAIGTHALFDFIAVMLTQYAISVILIECILTLSVMLLYLYIYWLMKKKRGKNI